jgi:hypothetical protein
MALCLLAATAEACMDKDRYPRNENEEIGQASDESATNESDDEGFEDVDEMDETEDEEES